MLQRFSVLFTVSLTCDVRRLSPAFSSGKCSVGKRSDIAGLNRLYRSFKSDTMKTSSWMYLNKDQFPSPWATSMVIQVRFSHITINLWHEADIRPPDI